MPAGTRSYASGSFLINLNGVKCGFVKSVEGGHVTADVVQEKPGPEYFVRKHIGAPKYEDFNLQIGLSLVTDIYDWISASWKGNYLRKDDSIIAADYDLNARSEREFFHALITETTIPAMDGSSKDPAYLSLKFSPEYTRYKKASGKISASLGKGKQKQWLPSNFRLAIDGLDCTRVSKIDGFTVKQTVVIDPVGEARDYPKEPGKLDFPNLRITLPETGSQTWFDWFEDFVLNGNNAADKERNGSLTFLAPDLKDELAEVRFFGLGIFRLGAAGPQPQRDQISSIVADLYCERMEFVYHP